MVYGAVVACISVAFYMLLNNLNAVMKPPWDTFQSFGSIFLGTIFACPQSLARYFYVKLFRRMKVGNTRWYLSITLAVVVMILAVILLLGTLIPQLVQSVALFQKITAPAKTLLGFLEKSPLKSLIGTDKLQLLT